MHLSVPATCIDKGLKRPMKSAAWQAAERHRYGQPLCPSLSYSSGVSQGARGGKLVALVLVEETSACRQSIPQKRLAFKDDFPSCNHKSRLCHCTTFRGCCPRCRLLSYRCCAHTNPVACTSSISSTSAPTGKASCVSAFEIDLQHTQYQDRIFSLNHQGDDSTQYGRHISTVATEHILEHLCIPRPELSMQNIVDGKRVRGESSARARSPARPRNFNGSLEMGCSASDVSYSRNIIIAVSYGSSVRWFAPIFCRNHSVPLPRADERWTLWTCFWRHA
nr:hypothetical protein CFP56_11499 [Quercus suber]